MIFADAAPLSQFFFIRAMLVQVVAKIAQAVLSQGNASLLGAFSQDRDYPFFAIQITCAQIDEF